jgi:IS605 OrfB family transposase
MSAKIKSPVRTLRLKVKPEGYKWLNAAAIEVNRVWNYANEVSYKAARPFAGSGRRLSAFDLDKLTAGAALVFDHIGSETIQRVNAEFAARRTQFKKAKLRWRVSKGARRSLGWIPFKAVQLKLKGKCVRFSGKAFRVFEQERLQGIRWKSGCFAQDAVGDWCLCVPVEYAVAQIPAPKLDVGIDLGLKTTAVTSDGARLEAGGFYRSIEPKIAQAQRRGHKRQAKRLHRTAARRRRDALHTFSNLIVKEYQTIYIGDVSSLKLVQTRMAKTVLDAGWGLLQMQLKYKGQQAGRSVRIVNERNTTRTCNDCRALTGPSGIDGLVVRTWTCRACGVTHERDENASRNIRFAGRSLPSVCRNEPSLAVAPPSQTLSRCEAGISTVQAAV